ncbi:lytic transglycosylase domain-containing protein [Paenibacillus agricola]|uniref:Lytic transglycosylase domain-containing protein n=1 Tax=Paenibacillus agricola TaxID=2716264 RepID=A0ABX0J618_9BACL|nr:lytic transglycosylase domain-containing protein [Paenibacillus agricola]NHN31388.1 lytic transglycosylase domain-containing protein [Paenibacillus agricola]
MSVSFWRKKRMFALLLLAFICFLFLTSSSVSKILYPIRYQEEIQKNALAYELDPFLIAAIIRVESNYVNDIESKKGAYGLMQLMPDTSNWIVEAGKFSPSFKKDLHNPAVSIQLGSWYLSWLHKQFNGNAVLAIAGYNAGQGNVFEWLEADVWDGTLEHAGSIPYGETRHYLQRVLYYYNKYDQLYAEDWGISPERQRSIGQAAK